MLIKLTADQISKYWTEIKASIEVIIPTVVGEDQQVRYNNLLMALLRDDMQAWVGLGKKTQRVEGLVITQVLNDHIGQVNSLLVYCVYAEQSDDRTWFEGTETLAKYAVGRKCTRIIGYTDRPGIKKFVERLGGDAKYTFISIPVRTVLEVLDEKQ